MKKALIHFLLFVASVYANASENVVELKGVWESEKKARYISDGSDFKCIYIPENIFYEYGHWLNKNGLEHIVKRNNEITATLILRIPSGLLGRVKAKLIIRNDQLVIETIDENVKKKILRYKRYK